MRIDRRETGRVECDCQLCSGRRTVAARWGKDHGVFEQQLSDFFSRVGRSTHARNIWADLRLYLPLMRRYPGIASAGIHRFRPYLTDSPAPNVDPALRSLAVIAQEIPELRDQIIEDVGDVLYEYKGLLPDLPAADVLDTLLSILEIPVSKRDRNLRNVARSMVSLGQQGIVVVGAGFSYDSMPVTAELSPLLVGLLRSEGIVNPVRFLEEHDQETWRIAKEREGDFKLMFAGWCRRSAPSFQHTAVCDMLHACQVSHLISFDWDDLCERAYEARFNKPIVKVTRDHVLPAQPALWKLHGDVEDLREPWVFPYEPGRVFGSLIESLNRILTSKPPAFALIVGYSEWEPEVREHLVEWIEKNVPLVLRVRPNWPRDDEDGIADPAKRFFQRLRSYMEIEGRPNLNA